ncbi:LysR family transcriptional regulator [Agromyces marinus]|uniref:LysR family transcriptional regulator n=2 Tax=Agromyces marinus TaxID=1389020 RepID=A0ABM8H0N2_9MICO|nr:LysR family transcriptional regulator [Agromyces marinus]UIP57526.1 HTH-type transcriptional regulator HdfR [Agromyces marinus]BDZ54335.1 LysR family transcriptional regulator [Agromyces marinus]
MDLRLLRYFLAVVEAGTVHGASATVHVAQPSLSRQIRRLEHDLGFELFERSARGLSLTAAGRAFLPVAEDLLTRATQARATARAISRGTVSDLTVVAAPTTVKDVISPFIVRAGASGIIGNAIEALPEHVYAAVERGDADFAVGTRIPPAELRSMVLGHAFLWAQMPAEHPLASRTGVPISELVQEPLILMSRAHGVRQMLDSAAARAGLAFTASVETTSPVLAQALAAAGRGVCVLSDDPQFGLDAVPISTSAGDLIITLFGVWDEMHYAGARIVECLRELSTFNAELYPQTVGIGAGATAP